MEDVVVHRTRKYLTASLARVNPPSYMGDGGLGDGGGGGVPNIV